MSILVTGGAGYIGSHMVLRLRDAGEDVVVMDDFSTGNRWLVPDEVPVVEGNVGDIDAARRAIAAHNVREIIHFAGSIIVPESVAEPLKYYANNVCVSRNLIEAAVTSGVERFIFSSTAAVYGVSDGSPIAENAPLDPVSPYGSSKLMTETMLRDVAKAAPLRYGVLRYFNVAGADPAGRSGHCTRTATHLIKVACQAALGQRDFVEIYGTDYDTADGTGTRDYIHVADLVDAHALLLEHLRAGKDSMTLNCGYGMGSTVRQVINEVRAVSGRNFEVREAPRRPGDPGSVVADVGKLRRHLQWTPKHQNLREMVQSAYDWELQLIERGKGAKPHQ